MKRSMIDLYDTENHLKLEQNLAIWREAKKTKGRSNYTQVKVR